MSKTLFGDKVNLALAYMMRHGDTQEARHAASQQGDSIDTAQWLTAGRRYRQESGKLRKAAEAAR